MKQVTLHIPDNKYPLLMELAHSLNFVKKIEVDENPGKEKILKGIKQAVKEMNLVKAGKLKARDARELINEL
jgi:hypothetical protein